MNMEFDAKKEIEQNFDKLGFEVKLTNDQGDYEIVETTYRSYLEDNVRDCKCYDIWVDELDEDEFDEDEGSWALKSWDHHNYKKSKIISYHDTEDAAELAYLEQLGSIHFDDPNRTMKWFATKEDAQKEIKFLTE